VIRRPERARTKKGPPDCGTCNSGTCSNRSTETFPLNLKLRMPLPNPLIVLMPERPLALFLKFVFQGHPWGFPGGFQGVRSMEPTTKTGGGPGYGSIAPLPREWKIREPLSRTKTSKMACCHKFVHKSRPSSH